MKLRCTLWRQKTALTGCSKVVVVLCSVCGVLREARHVWREEEEHAKLPDRLLPNFWEVFHEVISVFCHIPAVALQQLCRLTGSLTGSKPGEENTKSFRKICFKKEKLFLIFFFRFCFVCVCVAYTMVHRYGKYGKVQIPFLCVCVFFLNVVNLGLSF